MDLDCPGDVDVGGEFEAHSPTCRVYCGAPASGKRTCARRYCLANSFVMINMDTISEKIVEAGLSASQHDVNDRDSEHYKRVYRSAIYNTMYEVARENVLLGLDVCLVGPFTRELQMSVWPQMLCAQLGGGVAVEIVYVVCEDAARRRRMQLRGAPRDAAKLARWEAHAGAAYKPPRCAHQLLDNSAHEDAGQQMSERLRVSLQDYGMRPPQGDHPMQRPSYLLVHRLKAAPLWHRSEYSAQMDQVVAYLEACVDQLALEAARVRHLALSGHAAGGSVGASGGRWAVVDLQREGQGVPRVLQECPCAAAALQLPGCASGQRYSAFLFSFLKRGGSIARHYGPTNLRLRVILPLVVPANGTCSLFCANESVQLSRGRCIVFDDSFQHGSDFVGQGDEEDERVVLIVDLFHPDLTENERKCVSDMIQSVTK